MEWGERRTNRLHHYRRGVRWRRHAFADPNREFYRWLQSAEGGIAGGATNSWGANYGSEDPVPAGLPTFYGLSYDFQPVYHDPPSNEWFGFQAWSMERVAEYYLATTGNAAEASRNALAKAILDPWVTWAMSQTTVSATNFLISSKNGVERAARGFDRWRGVAGGESRAARHRA
jgi:hypothetical protein